MELTILGPLPAPLDDFGSGSYFARAGWLLYGFQSLLVVSSLVLTLLASHKSHRLRGVLLLLPLCLGVAATSVAAAIGSTHLSNLDKLGHPVGLYPGLLVMASYVFSGGVLLTIAFFARCSSHQ
jgi:hypothetical protein